MFRIRKVLTININLNLLMETESRRKQCFGKHTIKTYISTSNLILCYVNISKRLFAHPNVINIYKAYKVNIK